MNRKHRDGMACSIARAQGRSCGAALDRAMAHGQAQLALVCNLQRLPGAFVAICSASHEIKTMLRPVFDASASEAGGPQSQP